MVTKFKSDTTDADIEFSASGDKLLIELGNGFQWIELSKENLFDLIGQLLRIQSIIKKHK